MTPYLNKWLKEDKLKLHNSSADELTNLFKIIDRDISDASIKELSADRRFITAYNAILQLTTVVLRANGLRTNPNKAGHHRISIDALPEILGSKFQEITDYFHACRIKRNVSDYTSSGEISEKEVLEIVSEAKKFKSAVLQWVRKNYPKLSLDDV